MALFVYCTSVLSRACWDLGGIDEQWFRRRGVMETRYIRGINLFLPYACYTLIVLLIFPFVLRMNSWW